MWYERNEIKESNVGYGFSEQDKQKIQSTHSLQEMKNRAIDITTIAANCVQAAPDESPEKYIGKTPKQVALDTRVKWANESIVKCALIPSNSYAVKHPNESDCTYAVEQVRYGLHTSQAYRDSIIKGCPVPKIDEKYADRYVQLVTDELDFARTLPQLKDQIKYNRMRFEEEKAMLQKSQKKKR